MTAQACDKRAARAWLRLPMATRAQFPPPFIRRDPEENYREYVMLAASMNATPPPRPVPPEKPKRKPGKPARLNLGQAGWASVRRLMAYQGLSEDAAVARIAGRQRKLAKLVANAH